MILQRFNYCRDIPIIIIKNTSSLAYRDKPRSLQCHPVDINVVWIYFVFWRSIFLAWIEPPSFLVNLCKSTKNPLRGALVTWQDPKPKPSSFYVSPEKKNMSKKSVRHRAFLFNGVQQSNLYATLWITKDAHQLSTLHGTKIQSILAVWKFCFSVRCPFWVWEIPGGNGQREMVLLSSWVCVSNVCVLAVSLLVDGHSQKSGLLRSCADWLSTHLHMTIASMKNCCYS